MNMTAIYIPKTAKNIIYNTDPQNDVQAWLANFVVMGRLPKRIAPADEKCHK